MFQHTSVLKEELVQQIAPKASDHVIDATFGGGGHAAAILGQLSQGILLGIDRDAYAISHAEERFQTGIKNGQVLLQQGPFSKIREFANSRLKDQSIDIIYADLGVSSPQLDLADRGFSMMQDAALDMRMDQNSADQTAADLVNQYDELELTRIFREYGEEPKALHYARKICGRRAQKPFTRTKELADFLESVNPYRNAASRRHPATKIFQALRIEVNQELEEIQQFLGEAFDLLALGGRLAVISFHSLEDRIVKHFFKNLASIPGESASLQRLPIKQSDLPNPRAKIHKPFPIVPSEDELLSNPRSRSAKLRVLTKLHNENH